jgi:hypothetical protein
VKAGERVTRGQRIGSIGAHRSEENGKYPAHLHFGLHKGPYLQISPAWRRRTIEAAAKTGLPVGDPEHPTVPKFVKGKVASIELLADASAAVRFEDGQVSLLSLEVGSTAPADGKHPPPPDIMNWCSGYGDEETVAEWLRPSEWIPVRQVR